MSKQIELSELQRRGEAILDDLAQGQEPYIVARDGEPEAALVPYSDIRHWQESDLVAHERFDRMIERLGRLNAAFSEEEIARDVAEAIAGVRRGED